MANWINRNLGEVSLAVFAALIAGGFTLSYQLGQNAESLETIETDLVEVDTALAELNKAIATNLQSIENLRDGGQAIAGALDENTKGIEELRSVIEQRFTSLEFRMDLDSSDLKSILLSTNAVMNSSDVFYAATIDGAIWVFPDEDLRSRFSAAGYNAQAVSPYVSGYRLLPIDALE